MEFKKLYMMFFCLLFVDAVLSVPFRFRNGAQDCNTPRDEKTPLKAKCEKCCKEKYKGQKLAVDKFCKWVPNYEVKKGEFKSRCVDPPVLTDKFCSTTAEDRWVNPKQRDSKTEEKLERKAKGQTSTTYDERWEKEADACHSVCAPTFESAVTNKKCCRFKSPCCVQEGWCAGSP